MAIKINLGSGFKRIEGFVNVDGDPEVFPDYVVQLDSSDVHLPFDDNTVEEIKAFHILEHIGSGFIPLIKELYRVCQHGAIFDIIVPNETHSAFYGDVTHKRPITVNGMNMFSKKFNRNHIETIHSSSGMGLQYNIDFEIIHYEFEYDQFYVPMLTDFFKRKEAGKVSPEEDFSIQRLLREANNVALNTIIKMVAIKEQAE
jgi:predicted SAM-dependent methyltransferase